MKLSCTQENLNKGLLIVSRITTTRATLPILANVLISTDKGRLKLSSTDLEIGITTWLGAKIEQDGGLTIPARTFSEFISTNNDKTINLEAENTNLHLKSDHYEAHIKGIEVGEYPLIPEIRTSPVCEISSGALKEAIIQTVFAASTDEIRPILGGINFHFTEKELKLVATDSYRLAEKKIKGVAITSKPNNIIIPARTILELARIIQSDNEIIKIYLNENQVLFSLPDTHLISRLIEGSFPAYNQIIPKSFQSRAVIKTGDFVNALKMSSLFARESANNIRLKLKKGNLEIIAVSPQVGDTVAQIDAECEGESIEIAFNARYILDALNVVGESEVVLELNDINERKPSALKPRQNPDYLYIIMPLDTQS